MKASKRAIAMVCLCCSAGLWDGQSAAAEATVRWHSVTNDVPPPAFTLTPANLTTTNTAMFVAATDNKLYVNSCFASVQRGNPAIAIDSTNLTITVSFSAPLTNIACPTIVVPVSGVEGQFGPLSAGTWMFSILQNSYLFSVIEAPLPLSILRLTNALTFQIAWPVSGEPFALESNDNLSSGSWQAVTNPVTTSSNRNTVLIYGDSGSRFYRLRRLGP